MKKKTLKNKQKKKKNVMIFLKENKKINKNHLFFLKTIIKKKCFKEIIIFDKKKNKVILNK